MARMYDKQTLRGGSVMVRVVTRSVFKPSIGNTSCNTHVVHGTSQLYHLVSVFTSLVHP